MKLTRFLSIIPPVVPGSFVGVGYRTCDLLSRRRLAERIPLDELIHYFASSGRARSQEHPENIARQSICIRNS